MHRRSWNSRISGLALGMAFVLASCCVRLVLEHWYPPNQFTFSTFYVAVVLSSYFLEVSEAIFAAVLSGLIGYWAFAAPALSWKINDDGLMGLLFFGLTSTVDIYFITAMKRAVHRYQAERQRFEILAEGHAALFREHTDRTANYLNLLSILLKQYAESPSDRDMTPIDEAWRRASTLSSLDRSQSQARDAKTDFLVFARQLLENLTLTTDTRHVEVKATGDGSHIPSDRAALMAMVLIECSHLALASLRQVSNAGLDVHFEVRGDNMHLSLHATGYQHAQPGITSITRTADIIVSHLDGQLYVASLDNHLSFDLIAPVKAPQPTGISQHRQRLHVAGPHVTIN